MIPPLEINAPLEVTLLLLYSLLIFLVFDGVHCRMRHSKPHLSLGVATRKEVNSNSNSSCDRNP